MAAGIPTRLAPLTRAEGRRFGLTVGAAFLGFAALSRWRGHVVAPVLLATLGVLFVAGGLLVPGRMTPVFRGWMGLALAISKVTTPILMGVIYFVVLTPIALVARLLGHRPLARDPKAASLWAPHEAVGGRGGGMERQF